MTHRLRALSRIAALFAVLAVGTSCTGDEDPGLLPSQPSEPSEPSQPSEPSEPGPGGAAVGPGIGDPYYPDDGNLGYDVKSYRVKLDYFRADQSIAARTTITARSTASMRRFHLDLVGLTVTKVTVDGHPATFERMGAHELVIRLTQPIAKSSR